MQLYIAGEGELLGPYNLDLVQDLLRKGKLLETDLV